MPHDWLQTWGDAIEPDQLSGSFAIRFRNFLINEAAGLASITGARRDGRREIVILEVETNRPQRPAYSILHREPVAVVLFEDDTFAPTVLSLRSDFPDTPHQNWMPDGMPFSLCVDDRPWQDARPLYTPAELLHRIMKWFERAGRGGLHDLRQPLDPFFMRQGIDVVMPRNLFELAPSQRLELVGTRHDTDNLAVITVRLPLPGEQRGLNGALLFVALQIAPGTMGRMRRAPADLASLMRELGARGVNLADDLAARITAWSAEGGDSRARFSSRLGVLLQMPIIGPDGVTTGATDNVAFLTLATIGDTGIALGRLDRSPQSMKGGSRYTRLITPAVVDQGKLAAMPLLMGTAHVEFDRVRAAELSGKTADLPPRIVQVGAGTIGSLATEILVREGFGARWTTIDPDFLLPHNLARHDLSAADVGLPKAIALANRLRLLRSDLTADAIVADVLKAAELRDAIVGAISSADLVIDAAASVPVGRFLCDQEGAARRTSIFFNPAGTAVVLLMESADRKVDLRALEAAYYGAILQLPELHDHLSQSADAVPYAGACRAVTSRISASRAQTLTGLVTAELVDAVTKPDAVAQVWTLTSGGVASVHTIDVGSVQSASVAGWTITLPRSLEQRILQMRTANLPAETGGVVFGLVDLVRLRIDLVEAWPAPPGSCGSETEFIRGTKGLRQEVEKAIARTLEQVRYVGEWHSHPRRARTRPSPTDLCQLGWLTSTLSMDGCPALMLIAGDRGVSINLGQLIKPEDAAS